jgi:hypothetical protein
VLWLLCDGRRVAPLEVATTPSARSRGLRGRYRLDGALLLYHANVIHTLGMRFAIDVAFCDQDLQVRAVRTMVPYRYSRPRAGVTAVLEAEAGAFAGWAITVGGHLGIDRE